MPQDTVCGHKTGNLIGICVADAGIVFSETGDYILCVICNDPRDEAVSTAKIADISRVVREYRNP